jgi:DNA polymerase-3 subunit gamma/tau
MVKKGETKTEHRTALYRKYRPRSLDDIVSQNHATEILRRSLAAGKVSHAYLLTGPKGVGKTSIARILAHEINQLPYSSEGSHLDIIEIDAASNNGVDDVRELRDRVALAPISAAKKIYIIDEVHMLSKQAFNALLKTLEEPPAHVVFILATTDLHKVPGTIISRTQHFSFHAISRADLAVHLKKIAEGEGIMVTDEALDMIAARGDGSFRNAIGLLDQLSGYADDAQGITRELVETTLGFAPAESVDTLLGAVKNSDVALIISTLDQLEHQGIQPTVLTDQLIDSLHESLGEQPQLVDLLDALLAVPSSAQPRLKLLTTLIVATKPKPVQTKAAVATKPKPPTPTIIEAPVIIVDKAELEIPAPKATPPTTKPVKKQPFAWDNLIECTKQNMVALYSVLVKCGHDYAEGTLTLYAGKKFNKTKLDETKYHSQLQEALISIGCPDITIVTLAETKPPADEKLAKVAAMMGGGEEVSLDITEPET